MNCVNTIGAIQEAAVSSRFFGHYGLKRSKEVDDNKFERKLKGALEGFLFGGAIGLFTGSGAIMFLLAFTFAIYCFIHEEYAD